MRDETRLSAMALIGLTTLAIALALWTIGGPWQARSERRDDTRLQDLQALAQHVECLLQEGIALTGTSDACPVPARLEDPFTGARYRMEETSSGTARVCADFESATPSFAGSIPQGFDAGAGCLTVPQRLGTRP